MSDKPVPESPAQISDETNKYDHESARRVKRIKEIRNERGCTLKQALAIEIKEREPVEAVSTAPEMCLDVNGTFRCTLMPGHTSEHRDVSQAGYATVSWPKVSIPLPQQDGITPGYDHFHQENEWGVCRTCAQRKAKAIRSALPQQEEPAKCATSKAPEGWFCTRLLGHEGPCAAYRSHEVCIHGVGFPGDCAECLADPPICHHPIGDKACTLFLDHEGPHISPLLGQDEPANAKEIEVWIDPRTKEPCLRCDGTGKMPPWPGSKGLVVCGICRAEMRSPSTELPPRLKHLKEVCRHAVTKFELTQALTSLAEAQKRIEELETFNLAACETVQKLEKELGR